MLSSAGRLSISEKTGAAETMKQKTAEFQKSAANIICNFSCYLFAGMSACNVSANPC
jgi:hypothetical protein